MTWFHKTEGLRRGNREFFQNNFHIKIYSIPTSRKVWNAGRQKRKTIKFLNVKNYAGNQQVWWSSRQVRWSSGCTWRTVIFWINVKALANPSTLRFWMNARSLASPRKLIVYRMNVKALASPRTLFVWKILTADFVVSLVQWPSPSPSFDWFLDFGLLKGHFVNLIGYHQRDCSLLYRGPVHTTNKW